MLTTCTAAICPTHRAGSVVIVAYNNVIITPRTLVTGHKRRKRKTNFPAESFGPRANNGGGKRTVSGRMIIIIQSLRSRELYPHCVYNTHANNSPFVVDHRLLPSGRHGRWISHHDRYPGATTDGGDDSRWRMRFR